MIFLPPNSKPEVDNKMNFAKWLENIWRVLNAGIVDQELTFNASLSGEVEKLYIKNGIITRADLKP